MANNLGASSAALPNPFQQNSVAHPVVSSHIKIAQNETIALHGYRSMFNIDQQKEQYEQRMKQQQEQQQLQQQQSNQRPYHFNRNAHPKQQQQLHHNQNQRQQRSDRNAAPVANRPNGSYSSNWCDLCECGFKFPHQLEKHRDEHEKCWFENCTFEGHSKLLQKHIEVQHQCGLFQRIEKVETEEDIEKWREERRKRYPTKANIEARRQAQEERLKRGERIDEPKQRFGSMKNRRSAQQHHTTESNDSHKNRMDKKKSDKKRHRMRNKQKKRNGKEKSDECEKDESEKTTTSDAVSAETVDSASTVAQCSIEPNQKLVQNSSALASIMGMYGSDSDDDEYNDQANEQIQNKNTAAEEIICHNQIMDTSEMVTEMNPVKPESNQLNNDNITMDDMNSKRSASFSEELPPKQPRIELNMNENDQPINEIESDDDEAPDEQPIQRQSAHSQDKSDELESGPTKAKVQEAPASTSKALTNENIPKRRTVLDMTRKIRNQNSLLEKLLQKDIRHERNILLQCVRYVVENKFFGIGETDDKPNQPIDNL